MSDPSGNHQQQVSEGGAFIDLAPPPFRLSLRLVKVRSFLILTRRGTASTVGSLDDVTRFYKQVMISNLILGWWGIPFGFIWTPMALASNRKALNKVRQIAAAGAAPAGWHPDPTGRHGARYWDGSRWTDQVSDTSHDTLNVQP